MWFLKSSSKTDRKVLWKSTKCLEVIIFYQTSSTLDTLFLADEESGCTKLCRLIGFFMINFKNEGK